MTRRIHVTFENGVLIPQEKINFPEHGRFTILVDEQFPDDPAPEGGVDLVDWVSRHRIKIDPKIAQEIAESAEYSILNSEPDSMTPPTPNPRLNDPHDPMPQGGVELCDWWTRHRIQIDPDIAKEIAENPDYDIENS